MIDTESRPINIGIVGYGYWGPNLVRNFAEVETCQVKYVCDRLQRNLSKAQRRYPGMAVTKDYEVLLNDSELSAVIVATRVSSHFDLARQAMAAGKHVLIEKPLAASSAEAEELVRIAKEDKLVLMVGHTFKFSPPVIKAKKLISSGELGDIYYVTSSRVNLGIHQSDVSVIWDLAPHDLSIMMYWLGEEPSEIAACGRGCIDPAKPDVAFVNMRFPSGVVAELQLSWLSPVKLRRTVVIGSKKMLLYDDTEPVEALKIFDHGVEYKDPETFGEFQMSYRTGDITSPKLDSYEPLLAEATHFIKCVRLGKRPKTDGRDGLRVVKALEAAETSYASGGRYVDVQRRQATQT